MIVFSCPYPPFGIDPDGHRCRPFFTAFMGFPAYRIRFFRAGFCRLPRFMLEFWNFKHDRKSSNDIHAFDVSLI
jgi:hypothetical protein